MQIKWELSMDFMPGHNPRGEGLTRFMGDVSNAIMTIAENAADSKATVLLKTKVEHGE